MKQLLLLILLMNVSTSTYAGALSCTDLLKNNNYSDSAPRASIVTTNNLDKTFGLQTRILGRPVSLGRSVAKTLLTKFLNPFLKKNDPTTARLEERFVVGEAVASRLLDRSDLNWKRRDEVAEGNAFSTVTAYAGKFILNTGASTQAVAKVRFRKYYSHKADLSGSENMTSVFKGWTALELKVSGILGLDQVATYRESSFKPRVFVQDKVIKKLQKMKTGNFTNLEFKEAVIADILADVSPDESMNRGVEVRGLIDALFKLGETNPQIFRLESVVSYQRDSYKSESHAEGEYQYTQDRNIRVYEPRSNIGISSMENYFDRNAIYEVPKDFVFVELKSPTSVRSEDSKTYSELIGELDGLHQLNFNQGEGKFSLAGNIRDAYGQNDMSTKLAVEGLLFFLIKGTSNLPTPPNSKKIVELGEIDVAIPFQKNGETHRLILSYRANSLDGIRSGVLDSISMVDHFGRNINIDGSFSKELVNSALAGPDPISITLNNETVLIPAVISPEVALEYKDFFSRFYTNYSKREGNPREIESLTSITSSRGLTRYSRKMKVVNALNYVWSRVHRIGTQVLLTGAVILAYNHYSSAAIENNTLNMNQIDSAVFIENQQTYADGSVITVNTPDGPVDFVISQDTDGNIIGTPELEETVEPTNAPEDEG